MIEVITREFADIGYDVKYKLHNAKDFDVPQDRQRVFIVGTRTDIKANFVFPKKSKEKTTLKDAIYNLPDPDVSDVCDPPYSSRYMSRNRKRGWEEVSYTIPAMAKQVTLHPSSPDMRKVGKDKWEFGDSNETRRFSWQEAALIQTIPKQVEFQGNLLSKYKQIGNAVPVNLASHMAKQLKLTLDNA
ncbi:MAG: DNA cytosine methyltransferase [Candidatus Dojkabacteria bacterium]